MRHGTLLSRAPLARIIAASVRRSNCGTSGGIVQETWPINRVWRCGWWLRERRRFGLGLIGVSRNLWCVGVAVLVQLDLADAVMCFRRTVCEGSQLLVELERADLGSVLIADAPGMECLVHDG